MCALVANSCRMIRVFLQAHDVCRVLLNTTSESFAPSLARPQWFVQLFAWNQACIEQLETVLLPTRQVRRHG